MCSSKLETLRSGAAGGRKKPRKPMPVPMVEQPCNIGVQVHDRGPFSQPWIGLSHAYSSLFFVYAGSNYTLKWCPPQAKRAICRVILLEPWKGRLWREKWIARTASGGLFAGQIGRASCRERVCPYV